MCHEQAYTFRQTSIGLCYKRDEVILNQFCRDTASVMPLKIHPGRQWLPVFRPNGSLLPSVSPIMWLSVVPDGVGIQYQRRPHSVPTAPPFSTNGAPIQYQWRPHSVLMTPPFSTNGASIQYQLRPHSVSMTISQSGHLLAVCPS